MKSKWIASLLALCLAAPLVACRDEGPTERVGRKIDEAAEEAEGAFEDLGRQIDEAADESKQAADELREATE